jgi:uncharacterized protein YPO0396
MKVADQGVLPLKSPQFRMRQLQLCNWGTFSGIHRISIAEQGFLVVGPSGAGKSTILDAITALLVPPKWATFNMAARDDKTDKGDKRSDRTLVSYVRGAWAEQHDDESGNIVKRYLRPQTTFTAIALNYENPDGRRVALAQVMWLKGSSNASNDLRRLYLVLERPFDIEELKVFSANLDVRALKQSLPDAQIREEFKAYSERFCRLLGIENEMALRLLHKTQSAKSLGDLNTLLRDFMLELAKARKQIDVLKPARGAHLALEEKQREKNALDDLNVGLKPYRAMRRKRLLEERIQVLRVELESRNGEATRAQALYDNHNKHMKDLERRYQEVGGKDLAEHERELADLRAERENVGRRLKQAQAACIGLGRSLPDTPGGLAELLRDCRSEIEARGENAVTAQRNIIALDRRRAAAESAFEKAKTELDALRGQGSNLPAESLAFRMNIAKDLKLRHEDLPFVGELLQVKDEERIWQGAIERVMRGFALSLLVEEGNYAALSAYVNEHNLRTRLVYYRIDRRVPASLVSPSDSLIRKLDVKDGRFKNWLLAELQQRFDLHCVETMEEFRASDRALTKQGQIKSRLRHEKDDRYSVFDRKEWILGFENAAKRELYEAEAAQWASELAATIREINAFNDTVQNAQDRLMHCQALVNTEWREIDIAPLLDRIRTVEAEIEKAKGGNVPLQKVAKEIEKHKPILERAEKALLEAKGKCNDSQNAIKTQEAVLEKLINDASLVPPTPYQVSGLDIRFSHLTVTLENLDGLTVDVSQALHKDILAASAAISVHGQTIQAKFIEFKNSWPAEAGDMDATLASSADYFAKLERLEKDGLPAYEKRFFDLLHSQSHQNLAALLRQLSQARKEIIERMEAVNESLAKAPFSPDSYLQISVADRQLEEVHVFRRSLEDAIKYSMTDDGKAAEERFGVLKQLVDRLGSQEAGDKRWREQVLDVRQHVEFVGIEKNREGQPIEIYRSGAGKSGGQRQKLATTCLGAALRYQLGSTEEGVPSYATVVLDEAFDKADNEFTAISMNIFAEFGFQMVVATPLKSVMTLEPFIGGACFVQIKDRNKSGILPIEYDEERRKLDLPQPAVEESA